jgi:hypothetical protein
MLQTKVVEKIKTHVLVKVSSPTDAQLDNIKNNFKFALKLTLKKLLHVSV